MATLNDLSIIIPAYNAAAFIPDLLQSLLKAGACEAREVIVVDDGSSDDTATVAKRGRVLLPNIVVLRQENRGPGGARNTGLRHARGEYVHFVDADDALVENAYPKLARALANNPALIEFDYWRETRRGTLRRKTSIPSDAFEHGRVNERAVLNSGVTWTKVVRRDLALRVPFPEGRLYEDDPVFAVLPFLAASALKVDDALYIYRRPATSITRTVISLRKIEDRIAMAKTYRANCRMHGIDTRYPQAVEFRYFHMLAIRVWTTLLRSQLDERNARVREHARVVRREFPDIERNPYFARQSLRKRLATRLLLSPSLRGLSLAGLLLAGKMA